MKKFTVCNDIFFASDLKGIALVNKKSGFHFFIEYPEAAVWSVLAGGYNMKKTEIMLQAILNKNVTDTKSFIGRCLQNWRSADIIE
jgi:hypothetical protein